MRVFSFTLSLAALLWVAPEPAKAWWEEGHEVVARIAAAHLTPAARARVAELLNVENTPDAVANALAAASIWADQVKADTGTANWHFVDLAWQDGRADFAAHCANDDCATARIKLFAAQLKANDPNADERFNDSDALRFLVHFVGDIHQPLHSSNNADVGGNCELLRTSAGEAKNIHALWDGPMVAALGDDDTSVAAELNAEVDQMGDSARGDWTSGDAEDWAWEAHRVALAQIYKRLDIPKEDAATPEKCSEAPDEIQQWEGVVEDAYFQEMKPVVREQLEKGGLRLAKILNDVLTAAAATP